MILPFTVLNAIKKYPKESTNINILKMYKLKIIAGR